MSDYGDAIEQAKGALLDARDILTTWHKVDKTIDVLDELADATGYLLESIGESNPMSEPPRRFHVLFSGMVTVPADNRLQAEEMVGSWITGISEEGDDLDLTTFAMPI